MVKNSDDIIISKGNKYSKVIDLLYSAKQSGIDITLNKDQLQLRIHEDKTVDEKLLQEIKNYKPLIIEFLGKRNLKSEKIDSSYNKIKPFDRGEIKNIPLSFSQERLWFIDQMEGSVQYHIPDILRLKGKLNKDALEYALLHIVNRHEILRTVIRDLDGVGYQYVEEKNDWDLNIIDGTQFREDKVGLQKYIKALINEPFNLSEDHLIRVRIIKLDQEEHVLLIVLHHIASDAWSKSILVKEVTELYRSYIEQRPSKLPKLTIQYADFSVWQRNYLQGEILDNKIAYWKEKLSNVAGLHLPTDFSRPAIQTSNGATLSFKINKETSAGLQVLSSKSGATVFMTILAGLQALLYRYSGQEDICVGTPIAGRQQPEVEGLIGFFINTLALRSEVNGNESFIDLLEQVKNTTMEAFDHQDVPFEKIVETVVKERDLSRNPLFQVMLVLQNTPEVPRVSLGELTLSKEGTGQTAAKFDLNFIMHETPGSLRGSVQYNTDLYKQETIKRMIVHFEELLGSIIKDPGEKVSKLQMLTLGEEDQLLKDFNNTATGFQANKTVISLFEEQVNKSANSIALVYEGQELTYKELDEYSNKISRHLRAKGVKEETLVPICIERGFGMVAAILGILKAGAAYVPIDPEYPADRVSYMLEDTGAKLILSSKKSRQKLAENLEAEIVEIDSTNINEESTERIQLNIKPGSLAYVIYTSGSTGKPKGVMIEHSSLVNYLTNSKANYIKTEDEGAGSFLHLSFTFDGSLTAIFMPLIAGKSIVIASDKSMNVFEDENLQKYAPFDFIKITPSHLELLSDIGNRENWLAHTLVIGGEALYPGHFKPFVTRGIDVEIVNEYGPTETTVGCSTYRFSTLQSSENIQEGVPIGKPMDNVKMYILNEGRELQPLGAQGEIYIGGAGIARGYLNRDELTKERFIKNPFSAKEAPVLYKTGDIGRWLANGDIEYAGRTDDQVKIRGYRIELGEIENEILQSGLVQQAVVLAVAGTQGEKHLAGYFVPEASFAKEKLTDYLQRKLPTYMIPDIWIELAAMPITSNGKIDKKALPPADAAGQLRGEYVAPGNELEEQLAEIWQQMLHIERVGIHDNFFELGGHSLLAMRMVSAVRKQLAIEMPIKNLFLYPTVARLALQLQGNHTSPVIPAIVAGERPAQILLSFSQERLWFIDQMEGSVQYHIPMVLRLKGRLNKEALCQSLQAIVNRHEVLRTVFKEENGQASQQVQDKNQWALQEEENFSYKEEKADLQQYIRQQIATPFDLQKNHMLRATLVGLDKEEYVLILTMHHIASDGWSMPILIKEVTDLYRSYAENKPVELTPLEIQYADYAIWQRDYLKGEILEKKISYWKEKLSGVTGLQLPTDYARPAIQRMRGAAKRFTVAGELSEQLHQLSRQEGTTMFMTLLTVMNVLLYRYSGQEDICVGSPIANRAQSEVEGLIGFFVNTLALRSEVKGEETFKELLQQVKATTMGGYDHQDVPFEKVVEAVVKERDLSRSPLFQVMFMLQDTSERKAIDLGGLELSGESSESQTSKFELTFSINDTGKGLQCSIEYNTDLYKEETIDRMTGHFTELITSIIQQPGEKISKLPMLTAAEEEQLLKAFNDTASGYPKDKSIIDLFEEQAAKTPQSIALVYEEEELTYGELNERSNQLARYLQKKGVKEETLVPICVERGPGMIIGILGILKSGGSYVPIDPAYPQDRISYMLEDTAAGVIMSSKASKGKLPAKAGAEIITIDEDWEEISKEENTNLNTQIASHNLAYVIYTSGSTGKPKGVLVEQANVVSLVKGINYVSLNNEDKLLSTGSSSFDATTFEYWGMLLNGGKLILCEEAKLLNSDLLKKEIESRGVNKMWFTSSWFNQLVENDISIFANLQTILTGGEKLSEPHIQKIRQTYPGIEIINAYGPTENTTFSLTYTITETDITSNIPIGRPLNNRHAYILNESGQLAPVGIPGEIYLGGSGLARGYLNREELTAERFIENPFAKNGEGTGVSRLYKTGDIGRWLPDGNIEYLGRADDQVKLRGYRIELGEIESVIAQSGLVKQAVVLAPMHKSGHRYLAGYIVAELTFDKEALNSYLRSKLPEYMIPAVWIELDQMPLTSNGKIDKKALLPADAAEQLRGEYVAPSNELEEQFVDMWQELLGVKRVGVTDNFFELGGDSILTIQVVSRARRLGYELKPREIFIHQTIAKLSLVIEERSEAIVSGEQGLLKGPAGLLPIQQWYLEDNWREVSHCNQSVLLGIDKNISPALLGLTLEKLISHHDALRFKYFQKDGKWYHEYGINSAVLITEDLRFVEEGQLGAAITKIANIHQRSLDITKGDLVRMALLQTPEAEEKNRLLIIIHHLAIDGVSWRILIENIEYLVTEIKNNQKADLGIKSTSYRQWYEALKLYGERPDVLSQINYWENILNSYTPLSTYKPCNEKITAKDIYNETMVLEPLKTNQLVKEVPRIYNTAINDILLCALSMSLSNWGNTNKIVIGLEGHGREEIANDVDISRTVGWFTNLYPVLIEMNSTVDIEDIIKSVKDQLRQVPDKGLGFGVLKYINEEKRLLGKALWNVVFNYLGQLDSVVQAGKRLEGARESAGQTISDEFLEKENLSVNGSVKGGRLILSFRYNGKSYEKEAVSELVKNYKSNLELLIDHCIQQQKNGLILTDNAAPELESLPPKYHRTLTKGINNKYLVPINVSGGKIPLYIVAGGGGTARKFMNFARMLDPDQPVYCLQSPLEYADIKDFPGTIEEMAARFVEEIAQQDPHGPYSLAGHCTGGIIAFEIARQLKAKGEKIHSLAMFDTVANSINERMAKNSIKFYQAPTINIKRFIAKAKLKLEFEFFLLTKHKKKAVEYKINSLKSFIKKFRKNDRNKEMGILEVLKYSEKIYSEAHRNYKYIPYDGEIILFYPKERNFFTDADSNIIFKTRQLNDSKKNRWSHYAEGIKIYELEGEHSTIFENEMAKEFAQTLQKYLNDEF